jgi:aspartate racemase
MATGPVKSESNLEEVSTTCDSGWVKPQHSARMMTDDPPAIAGGTDCIQQGDKVQMKPSKPILGVLGGMGALASAEFVKTIYELSGEQSAPEQSAPIVLLNSDPTFPDRTEALLRGDTQLLLGKLTESLESLCEMGASQIVICCMTIHYLLPQLPSALRERIISLPDVIFSSVESLKKKHLVICSNGTVKLGLLQRHPRWEQARDYFIFPSETEQQRMHDLIYEVKLNRNLLEARSFVETLLSTHRVASFIAACSEIHLLAKQFAPSGQEQRGYGCIDPLTIIARQMVEQSFASESSHSHRASARC